jgi:hypothetical protein
MEKISFWKKLNSIKVFIFMLVFCSTNYFMQVGKIRGMEYVSIMTLIVGIFSWAHEHTKGLAEKCDCEEKE